MVAEEQVTLRAARSSQLGLMFGPRVGVLPCIGFIRGGHPSGLGGGVSVNAMPGTAVSEVDLGNLAGGVGELAEGVGDWERVFYLKRPD